MIGGDATFPDHVINTDDHFPNWLYFGCRGRGNPLLVRLSSFCWEETFPLLLLLASVGRPEGRAGQKREAVVGSGPVELPVKTVPVLGFRDDNRLSGNKLTPGTEMAGGFGYSWHIYNLN